MKRYIKNFMMAMMIGATVFGSSCTDSFEEVNTDPDSPTDVPTTNLLAYSLYYTSYRLYDRWFASPAIISVRVYRIRTGSICIVY